MLLIYKYLDYYDLLIILYIQTSMEFSEGLTDVISDYWYSDFDHIISQYCGWSDINNIHIVRHLKDYTVVIRKNLA